MKKSEVLSIFANSTKALTPDEVRGRLRPAPDRRSLYSYLGRLARQGLLEPARVGPSNRLAYRLTERGLQRLEYFRQRGA